MNCDYKSCSLLYSTGSLVLSVLTAPVLSANEIIEQPHRVNCTCFPIIIKKPTKATKSKRESNHIVHALLQMSSEAIAVQEPDIYGQRHPVETQELIQRKLAEFHGQLDDIIAKHPNVQKAKEKGLHTDDFALQFLRCEVFDTTLAVGRYCRYWDKRVAVFGPDRAFLPLTLCQAVRPDRVALEQNFARVSHEPDKDKRSYLFLDPSKQQIGTYAPESMVRAMWYFIHALLSEDELVQKKGLICVCFPPHASFRQFDRYLVRQMLASVQGCLPVRFSAFHICHPGRFFRVLFPIAQVFMTKRTKKRILVHAGTFEHVLDQMLSRFGFDKADLPSEIGGERKLDVKMWLAERERQRK